MIYYGLELASGTTANNLTVENGTTLPTTNLHAGRIFFESTAKNLRLYTGTEWKVISTDAPPAVTGVITFNGRNGAVVFTAADVQNVINNVILPTASATVAGVVKVGSGLLISGGVLSVNTSGSAVAGVSSFNGRTGDIILTSADVSPNLPVATGSTLGAIKVGSRLTISNGVLSADVQASGAFPAGTIMIFYNAAAPTGWTQITSDTANNRMIRVVAGAGQGGGGYHDPTYMNVVPAHTHSFGTGGVSADHAHGDYGHTHGYQDRYFIERGSKIGTGSNTIYTGGNIGGSGSLDWDNDRFVFVNATTATGHANLAGMNSNHAHTGTTDNGSSQVNWSPRYLNFILCSKN